MESFLDDQDPGVPLDAARSWLEASPLRVLLRLIGERPDDWDLGLL